MTVKDFGSGSGFRVPVSGFLGLGFRELIAFFESLVLPLAMPVLLSAHLSLHSKFNPTFPHCRSVWLCPNQKRFEPPPGFAWDDPESADFMVVPREDTPPLASYWATPDRPGGNSGAKR